MLIKEVRALSPRFETLNLILPFVFLVLLAMQKVLFPGGISKDHISLIMGFAATLFFNTVHIGLTYSMITLFPESKEWVNQRTSWRKFWLISTVVMGLAALWALVGYEYLPQVLPYTKVVMQVYVAASLWHTLAQTQGLSLIYNYKLRWTGELTQEETRTLSRHGKFERVMVRVFFVTLLLGSLTFWYEMHELKQYAFLLGAVIVAVLMTSIAFTKVFDKTNKLMFAARYLLWALAPGNPLALGTVLACHGIEYALLYRSMREKSSLPPSTNERWVTAGHMLLFLCLGAFSHQSFGHFLETNSHYSPFRIIAAIALALSLLHFYWDRYFFRLRPSSTSSGKSLI